MTGLFYSFVVAASTLCVGGQRLSAALSSAPWADTRIWVSRRLGGNSSVINWRHQLLLSAAEVSAVWAAALSSAVLAEMPVLYWQMSGQLAALSSASACR
jgi:hypothetical protein